MNRLGAPAFARPRSATGFGKNLVPAKTLVPQHIRDEAEAKVKNEGFDNLAQWLRMALIGKARGVDTLRSVAEQQLRSVSEIVPEKVQRET